VHRRTLFKSSTLMPPQPLAMSTMHSSLMHTLAPKVIPYTKLTVAKVSDYVTEYEAHITRGHSRVVEGMFLEGTAAYGGILPDIRVDAEAIALIRKHFRDSKCAEIVDIDRAIDCAEKIVRVLLPEQHHEKLAEFLHTDISHKSEDQYICVLE